jgi:hypothetical protein
MANARKLRWVAAVSVFLSFVQRRRTRLLDSSAIAGHEVSRPAIAVSVAASFSFSYGILGFGDAFTLYQRTIRFVNCAEHVFDLPRRTDRTTGYELKITERRVVSRDAAPKRRTQTVAFRQFDLS